MIASSQRHIGKTIVQHIRNSRYSLFFISSKKSERPVGTDGVTAGFLISVQPRVRQ